MLNQSFGHKDPQTKGWSINRENIRKEVPKPVALCFFRFLVCETKTLCTHIVSKLWMAAMTSCGVICMAWVGGMERWIGMSNRHTNHFIGIAVYL